MSNDQSSHQLTTFGEWCLALTRVGAEEHLLVESQAGSGEPERIDVAM